MPLGSAERALPEANSHAFLLSARDWIAYSTAFADREVYPRAYSHVRAYLLPDGKPNRGAFFHRIYKRDTKQLDFWACLMEQKEQGQRGGSNEQIRRTMVDSLCSLPDQNQAPAIKYCQEEKDKEYGVLGAWHSNRLLHVRVKINSRGCKDPRPLEPHQGQRPQHIGRCAQ